MTSFFITILNKIRKDVISYWKNFAVKPANLNNFAKNLTMSSSIDICIASIPDNSLQSIAKKVKAGGRISDAECLLLFEKGSLAFVGALANFIREKLHGNKTYFNRNFHIEPTNVCVFSCKFCSYSRLYAHKEEGWELSIDQMLDIVKSYDGKPITEVHIVG